MRSAAALTTTTVESYRPDGVCQWTASKTILTMTPIIAIAR